MELHCFIRDRDILLQRLLQSCESRTTERREKAWITGMAMRVAEFD